jgi:hypothetical protein
MLDPEPWRFVDLLAVLSLSPSLSVFSGFLAPALLKIMFETAASV